MADFLQTLGLKTIHLTPKEHDVSIALISHLPSAVSIAMCNVVASCINWKNACRLAATGFRDTSRLAQAPIDLTTEFFVENRENSVESIENCIQELKKLQNAIYEKNGQELKKLLTQAQKTRSSWYNKSRFSN